MFLFKRDPSVPLDVRSLMLRLIVAVIVFWVVLFYLVPLITIQPIHTILYVGTIILAIFFLLDLIF